jgi:hypothetical protein
VFHPFCHIGKVKKELDHEDSHLNLDETARLLQDLHEAQAERGGSRPSSNLSSLSTASEREHPPPGKGLIQVSSGDPHWVEDQAHRAKVVALAQRFILGGFYTLVHPWGPEHLFGL